MANDERTAGFMQALGFSQPKAPPPYVRGNDSMATAANIVRTSGQGPMTRLIAGGIGGVGGLVTGENNGRSVRGFFGNVTQSMRRQDDYNEAKQMGISVEKLEARRLLSKELEGINLGEGKLEDQIKAATEIARKANAAGDFEIAMNAAAMRAQLKKQLNEQIEAGIANENAKVDLEDDESKSEMGVTASIIGKEAEYGEGKAVRLTASRAADMKLDPSTVGKFLFIDADGNRHIVDGAEVIPKDAAFAKFGNGIKPADDNVLKLAAANGATPGAIDKVRSPLVDARKNSSILIDIVGNLQELTNPQFAMDWTGRSAIQANRVLQLSENAAKLLMDADNGMGASNKTESYRNGGKYSWRGKDVAGPAEQHTLIMEAAKDQGFMVKLLNSISGNDTGTINDYLPSNITASFAGRTAQEIAMISEQYLSNVMELAYLDARMEEPSNRGLSDNDIKNALQRVGAHTANPASFAKRQVQLMDRLESAVTSLGNLIQVPEGARTTREEVRDFIYSPEAKAEVLTGIRDARKALIGLAAGDTTVRQPQQQPGNFEKVDQILANPDQVDEALFKSLSDEEYAELQRRMAEQVKGQ